MESRPQHQKRTLALPQEVEHWSLTTLRNKLIKIGAKMVRHGRYVTFQLTEVAIPRTLFVEILRLIDGPRPAPSRYDSGRSSIIRIARQDNRLVEEGRSLCRRPDSPSTTLFATLPVTASAVMGAEKQINLAATEYPPYYGKDLEGHGFMTQLIIEAFARVSYDVR